MKEDTVSESRTPVSVKRERAHYTAVRACIAWLHTRAADMNDPHAKAVLNSAAYALGLDKPPFAGSEPKVSAQ